MKKITFRKLFEDYIPLATDSTLETNQEKQTLRLEHFLAVFILLLLGWIFGISAFILELFAVRKFNHFNSMHEDGIEDSMEPTEDSEVQINSKVRNICT